MKYQLAAALAACAVGAPALATEGGGGVYPNGNENFLVGAMPPPGFYAMVYTSYDHLNKLRDKDGNQVPVAFDVKVGAVAPRAIWVTDTKILGGQLAWHIIAPLLSVDVSVAGASQKKSGLGDIVFGPGLGYHVSEKLHYVFALDVNAPTGSYDKNNLANLSRHYWNLEPLAAISYVQAAGLNADIKFHYDFNAENKATRYKSGQEFHFDYSMGYGFGNGWVAGAGGYVYQQVTDDKLNGATVPDAKGSAMGFGPSIKYDDGKGFFITAKLQKDFSVKNRAEGTALKVKFSIPF